MATQLLAVGSTAASSSELTVTSAIAICLKGLTDAKADVNIELKDDAGGFTEVGELTSSQPATLLVAPGTYRFTRVAGSTCGVFSA